MLKFDSICAISPKASTSSRPSIVRDECIICMEVIGSKSHLRVPCGHFYDEKCLTSLVQSASKDESTFPPRCCQQPIPQASFLPFLPRNIRGEFEKAAAEFSIKPRDRVYCSNRTCSEFLASASGDSSIRSFECPKCDHSTCPVCRKGAHPAIKTCEPEGTDSGIEALLNENKWQRCPECHWIIELTQGCYHISCRCSAQFCYVCTAKWKTCECAQWDERNLLVEAERRVDAEMEEEVVRPMAPAAERQTRVQNMTNRLRQNHVCNHSWYVNHGGAECENCHTYLNRYLLVSTHIFLACNYV